MREATVQRAFSGVSREWGGTNMVVSLPHCPGRTSVSMVMRYLGGGWVAVV